MQYCKLVQFHLKRSADWLDFPNVWKEFVLETTPSSIQYLRVLTMNILSSNLEKSAVELLEVMISSTVNFLLL